MQIQVQRALISVSDKTGLADFAAGLAELGIEILSTGGTHRAICEAGVAVREVSEYTGFPEIMDGRVKTLVPQVHGGILALRDEAGHRAAMEEHGIGPIDLVVVNLYPFEQTVSREGVERAEAIEQIDIGGPTMVRSAAKNHRWVGVVTDPADYGRVLAGLREGSGALSNELRRELAVKAFSLTARYDSAISRWLHDREVEDGRVESPWSESFTLAGLKGFDLRYGENPHQTAAFYRLCDSDEPSVVSAEVLGGKALSYNNLIDLDAALALAKEFDEPFCAVTKHNNPCGAATADSLAQALEHAWAGDPVSAFGSVLAFTRPLNMGCARFLADGGRFVEAIVAPGFEPDALEHLQTKPKWGKNVRLLACGPLSGASRRVADVEMKKLVGGFLIQGRDLMVVDPADYEVVTEAQPSPEQLASLQFADKIAKHVKSNAIVIAKGSRVLGVGAGQMSRVDSVHLAVGKAGEEVTDSVLGSDAFFPFPDGVEVAMDAGVRAFLQPGGSIRDKKVIAACNERGVPMVFTRTRHFRH